LREIGTRLIVDEQNISNSTTALNITRTLKNRQARILWEVVVGKREFTQKVEGVFLSLNLLCVQTIQAETNVRRIALGRKFIFQALPAAMGI